MYDLLIVGCMLVAISFIGLTLQQVAKREMRVRYLEARIEAYESAVDMYQRSREYHVIGDVSAATVLHGIAEVRVAIARGHQPVDLRA